MASTDLLQDVEPLEALSAEAMDSLESLVVRSGWNQTRKDWEVFAREGSIFVMRDMGGSIIASGAVLPFGESIAWISMILVSPEARGRGFGTAVFRRCVAAIECQGRQAFLDATPAGLPVYTRLGFRPLLTFTRWSRESDLSAVERGSPTLDVSDYLSELISLDAFAFGAPRAALLTQILSRAGAYCLNINRGFAVVRPGRVAHHIGPLLARDAGTAAALMHAAAAPLPKVIIDVPDQRNELNDQLTELGFRRQRSFVRMSLHHSAVGRLDLIHAIAGPEFG
jgi:GNAT superfamily N-acetyltransferase